MKKRGIASLVAFGISNTVQAMTTQEVIDFANGNTCKIQAYHIKPIDNNLENFTFVVLNDQHWSQRRWPHQFPISDTYNNFKIKCVSANSNEWNI
jgi:hypothetical protein